jgi:hypothetical protein
MYRDVQGREEGSGDGERIDVTGDGHDGGGDASSSAPHRATLVRAARSSFATSKATRTAPPLLLRPLNSVHL